MAAYFAVVAWQRVYMPQYYYSEIIKKDEMDGHAAAGKPERKKRPLGRSRSRRNDNITMDLRVCESM
jgi:hypothetical protein